MGKLCRSSVIPELSRKLSLAPFKNQLKLCALSCEACGACGGYGLPIS